MVTHDKFAQDSYRTCGIMVAIAVFVIVCILVSVAVSI